MKELIGEIEGLLGGLGSDLEHLSEEESDVLVKFTRNIESIALYREIFGIKRESIRPKTNYQVFNQNVWGSLTRMLEAYERLVRLESFLAVSDVFILKDEHVLKALARALVCSRTLAVCYESESDYELFLSCEEEAEGFHNINPEKLINECQDLLGENAIREPTKQELKEH
jgi:hypothetical protein